MELYPAIDLRHGKVVRLRQGDPTRQTEFDDDPLAAARRWTDAGARWLHVVNLDGAIDYGGPAAEANVRLLPALVGLGPRVQFGGGVRSLADMEHVVRMGVSRVVLGSVAVEQPEIVAEAIQWFSASMVVVGLDARDGQVRTRGWQQDGGLTAVDLGRRMRERGVELGLYTDIARDGEGAGLDVDGVVFLAHETGLRIIASGGVNGLEDVRRLAAATRTESGVDGVVIGRALYEGTLDLRQALAEVE